MYAGLRVSQLPQHYLAWIVGYSSIGCPEVVMPKEQPRASQTHFRFSKPAIYFAALNELVHRNRCLICDGPLVPFKTTQDWRTRLLHKKCYFDHLDNGCEYIPDSGADLSDA